jgi:hypothetical protein
VYPARKRTEMLSKNQQFIGRRRGRQNEKEEKRKQEKISSSDKQQI